MEKVFVGVDGGGTGLRLCVEDATGKTLFTQEGGAANIRVSPHDTWQAIISALQQGFASIDQPFPRNDVQYYGSFGLAGSEYQPALQAFLNHAHPFQKLIVSSDAKIACLGAHGNQPGAIIIVGTGIIGYQQEGEQSTRVGGWGFPHDDIGSGAHLGMQAVLLTFKAFDGRAASSPLTDAMQNEWSSPEKLLAHFHGSHAKKFASVAPLVFVAAQNDPAARCLIQNTCDAIYEISRALFQQQTQSEDPLPLALMGGLSSPLMPYLTELFKARLRKPLMSPEKGALLLLR